MAVFQVISSHATFSILLARKKRNFYMHYNFLNEGKFSYITNIASGALCKNINITNFWPKFNQSKMPKKYKIYIIPLQKVCYAIIFLIF